MAGGAVIARPLRDGSGATFQLANVERGSDAAELTGGVIYDGLTGAPIQASNRFPVDADQAEAAATTAAHSSTTSTSVDVRGYATVTVAATGTYTGLLSVFEVSHDGGTTWSAVTGFLPGTAGATATGLSANGLWFINVAGLTHFRIRTAAIASGTLNLTLIPSAFPVSQFLQMTSGSPSDSYANATGINVIGQGMMWAADNGQWARVPSNAYATALASAARTTTAGGTSADINNLGHRGVQIYLNVTSAGTGSIQANVQGRDMVGGAYFKLAADPTAVTANGLFVYEFYPGASSAAAGGITARTSCVVPRVWRVIVTHGNANSITYSVGYSLMI